jgi:hypothetical protein
LPPLNPISVNAEMGTVIHSRPHWMVKSGGKELSPEERIPRIKRQPGNALYMPFVAVQIGVARGRVLEANELPARIQTVEDIGGVWHATVVIPAGFIGDISHNLARSGPSFSKLTH